jgi:hypothetical protein
VVILDEIELEWSGKKRLGQSVDGIFTKNVHEPAMRLNAQWSIANTTERTSGIADQSVEC